MTALLDVRTGKVDVNGFAPVDLIRTSHVFLMRHALKDLIRTALVSLTGLHWYF
jgi:hypothetical protein